MTKDRCNARFLVLYGSQTGQAKAIAEELTETAASQGMSPELHCLSLTEKKFCIERETYAVFVASTTGEGEGPETAQRFWRRIKRTTLATDYLAHLNYAFLGLGDSNYNNFCNFGKCLDRRLQELGARHFCPPAFADDAIGLEVAAEPWMEDVLKTLREIFGISDDMANETSTSNIIAQSDSTSKPAENGQPETQEAILKSDILNPNGKVKEIDSLKSTKIGDIGISNNELLGDTTSKTDSVQLSLISSTAKSSNETINSKTAHFETSDTIFSLSSDVIKDNNSQIPGPELSANVVTKLPSTIDKGVPTCVENHPVSNVSCDDVSTGICGDKSVEVVERTESLQFSSLPLCDIPLTLPLCPARFLKLTFTAEENHDMSSLPIQNGCSYPGSRSQVTRVPIVSARRLTSDDAVKTALLLQLDVTGCDWSYEPGDSVGVICAHSDNEITDLIARLGLTSVSHTVCTIDLMPGTTKRNAAIPPYLPRAATIFHVLRTCIEIRDVPKKVFLRALVEFTLNPPEQRRLQELCSKQGAEDYARFIRQPGLSLVDLLHAFPSCNPPVELLLEHLPRMQPRAYSAASSNLSSPGRLEFVFNIVEQSQRDGRHASRQGVCTSWLDCITATLQAAASGTDSLETDFSKLNIDGQIGPDGDKENTQLIPIYLRTNHSFRLPECLSVPIIMIGPGTGVSPFIGFLKHRSMQLATLNVDKSTVSQAWLFYGCRHQDKDFLFRRELELFSSTGVLSKFCVSFSRDDQDPSAPRYVQDSMRLHGLELATLVHSSNATVYVCGDASGMAPQVNSTFKDLLVLHRGLSVNEADSYLTTMRLNKRYHEDIWK